MKYRCPEWLHCHPGADLAIISAVLLDGARVIAGPSTLGFSASAPSCSAAISYSKIHLPGKGLNLIQLDS